MKMTLDIKTLVIGFLMGVLFVCALGGRGVSDSASFGVAVPSGDRVLVKTERGHAYLVNADTGRATPISFTGKPDRDIKLY